MPIRMRDIRLKQTRGPNGPIGPLERSWGRPGLPLRIACRRFLPPQGNSQVPQTALPRGKSVDTSKMRCFVPASNIPKPKTGTHLELATLASFPFPSPLHARGALTYHQGAKGPDAHLPPAGVHGPASPPASHLGGAEGFGGARSSQNHWE